MPRSLTRPGRAWRRVRRAVLARRRLLAVLLVGLAVVSAVRAYSAPPPETVAVLTAARDLAPGTVVHGRDVVEADYSPDLVPDGAAPNAAAVVGRTTTGPIRRGEPITDARVLAEDLLAGYPGRVAAPVRVGDPGTARLLRVGDRVTLFASDPQGEAEPVEAAHDVPVVALPRDAGSGLTGTGGSLLVVAVDPDTARSLAGHGVASWLSAVLVR